MKNAFIRNKNIGIKNSARVLALLMIAFCSLVFPQNAGAATKTATLTGNWSDSNIWSPVGVPDSTDDIIINSGLTITVDGLYTCNSFDLGNTTSGATTVKIITAGKTLTIKGDLRYNPNSKNSTYIMDAGPGTIKVAGTFSHWSITGTNTFKVGTGTLNFTPAITIADAGQHITFTGAGIVTFGSDFADSKDNLDFYVGCTVNFYGAYNVTSTTVDWTTIGTANFYGTGTFTPNADVLFNHVNIMAGAATTMAVGSGDVMIEGSLSIGAAATFTTNEDLEIRGDLTNSGGTFSAVGRTIKMGGELGTIGGSSPFTFTTLQIGGTKNKDVSYTMSTNITATSLTLSSTGKNRTFNMATGKALTVTGNLTINQPTRNKRNAIVNINGGTCTVGGNLIFAGSSSTATRTCQVNVTSGSFDLTGSVTWLSNNVVATEVISVSTGTINFGSSLVMATKSGTLKITGSGTMNFNGTSAPSLNFGGAVVPVFTTSYGSKIKIAKGLTNSSILTFAEGSNTTFTGTGTITPSATLTFGSVTIDAGNTVTAAGDMNVKGDWSNYGTFTPATYSVVFNGGGTQDIFKTGGEIFYKMTVTPYGTVVRMLGDVTVSNSLTMSGASVDMNGYTFSLGNGSGAALVWSFGQFYGGTFRRYWPSGTAITSTSGNYYGLFPIGTYVYFRPISINSTSNATTGGYVSAVHNNAAGAADIVYTDNEGSNMEQIAVVNSELSTTTLAGGTYNLGVKFSNLGSQGNVANLKLLTYTGGVMGSVGTHVTTAGPLGSPTGYRNGLSVSNLNNVFVLGTNDKSTTPMYNYVFSRKDGNWNDVTPGDGTWSFAEGGAGASCDCLPGGSGYAVISQNQTVTLTATDSVKFMDIDTGGRLVINSSKTMNCGGNIIMYGTGNFTNNGTLNVVGELLMSSATSPIVNNNVNVTGWFTLPVGTAYTQSSGTLTVGGDIEISGAMSMGSGASMVLNRSGGFISGTGTYTTASGGSFPITNNKTIVPGTTITIGTPSVNTTLSIAAGTIVNNIGAITVNGNVTGANGSTSIWLNNANALLSVSGTLLSTGILDASINPNTVEYSGSGAQTIKVPLATYSKLKAVNAGTKTLSADVIVDNEVILGGTAILDEGTNILYGDAGLTMTGTSELKLQRSVKEVYPELSGIYTCTGGTVTVNQTADSAQIREARYYNLKLNGTKPYDLSAVSFIDNNLDVLNSARITSNSILTVAGTFTHNSSGTSILEDSIAVNGIVLTAGTLNDGGQSINVMGSGGWTKNGGTFTSTVGGTVYFTGTDAQTLGGTTATQTFQNLTVNKASNTVTVGGSTTTLSMNRDMSLNSGTFDAGTATNINMTAGDWYNNGGTFSPRTGTVTFNSTSDQAIQGTGTGQNFNNLTIAKTASELAVGGSVDTIALSGNMTLTSGILTAGELTDVIMTAGNWTNNGATFAPDNSTVTFNGSGAQAINGTAASQTFNGLTVSKSSNTLSVGGSTTSLTLNGNMKLSSGTFSNGTATNIYSKGNWTNNGGGFMFGTGTVHFTGTTAQAINGSASTQSFYNITVNKASDTLTLAGSTTSLTLDANMTLTAGHFNGGTATTINMTAGNWTNNGGTFLPGTSTALFSGTGAQNINGTAASQTFNNVTVDKSSSTLTVGGSTTSMTLNGNMLLSTGTLDKGTATNIYVGGDWTNNGGSFTYSTGSVTFNGTGNQAINGSAATQTFYNMAVNKSSNTVSISGSTMTLNIGANMTLTAGTLGGGTATTINMTSGNWTSNGGTFSPGTSTVVFNSGGAQAINGTSAAQSFYNLNISKSDNSLTLGGSLANMTLNGALNLSLGTLNDGGKNITINGANGWNRTGGIFTTTGRVIFGGSSPQLIQGSVATTFYQLEMNGAGGYLEY
ncbi:MAG: hypothetical protein IPP77_02875 [Bacteroidetes bacterium]|nr:hypothetical protein [Bacteroidota bacterium]